MTIEWGLDIGHGEDTWERTGGKGVYVPGDLGGGRMEEHWFNSAVAIYTEQLLNYNGIQVYMAQKPYEREVPLSTRTDLYNARNVRGVLSIHANAGASQADGFCAFYWYNASNSKHLANVWMKYAKLIMGSDMDVFGTGAIASVPDTWTNFHMVRETKMKAILTENGFMTNLNDLRDLLDDGFRRKVAEVNARTICEIEGITFKPIPVSTAGEEPEPKEGEKLYKPSNMALIDATATVLARFANSDVHGDKAISDSWKQKAIDGTLTESDAIGLIYIALARGLIQGDANL